MKITFLSLLMSAVLCINAGAASLKVATFNNQYENKYHPWAERSHRVKALIDEQQFDIVGMQEPFWNQVRDMAAYLTDYDWVGNSTDGKIEDGYWHYNPIFYKKSSVELLEWGSFWFSQTPDVPASKSWDAHTSRFCVWAHFRDKKTGKDFYHFNSHFDHRGETARQESAKLLLKKYDEIAHGKPAFFTGDYNTFEDTPAYNIILTKMKDSFLISKKVYGRGIASWNDWKPARATDKPENYDHIFVTPGSKVKSWKLITDEYSGAYPSDHFPIAIQWRFW